MGNNKDKKGKKGGGKASTLFFILILLVAGTGAVGYFYPDTPVVGDLVGKFFKKASEGQDKSGVYTVTVKKLVLDPQEFDEGATVDMQIIVKRVDKEGTETEVWESAETGDNLRTVGEHELAANWLETPFEITWEHGDEIIVEVWDYTGFDTLVARYKSSAGKKEFPLDGTQSLSIMEGDREINERKGGTNQIVFEAERTGDILPEGEE